MAFTKSYLRFQWILLLVLYTTISLSNGFKQELTLYKNDGNGFYFHTHVSDATIYDFSQVTKVCAKGLWQTYYKTNFTTAEMYWGYSNSDAIHCQPFFAAELGLGSFRYFGANDTSVDAVSLYPEEYYGGEEILVTEIAHAEILHPIKSFAITGNSSWTFFEGTHLQGKSICYKVPHFPGSTFSLDNVNVLNLTTVGSVRKGCGNDQI